MDIKSIQSKSNNIWSIWVGLIDLGLGWQLIAIPFGWCGLKERRLGLQIDMRAKKGWGVPAILFSRFFFPLLS